MVHPETEEEGRRPLAITLLTALYFFFFLLGISTVGHPFPLFGHIFEGEASTCIIFVDCLATLYLVLGIVKRQLYTWYLLIAYNLFEIANIIINLNLITLEDLEKATGGRVSREALVSNNIATALAILLLTQFIYRHKRYFSNRAKFLF